MGPGPEEEDRALLDGSTERGTDMDDFGFDTEDLGLEDLPEAQLLQLNGGARKGSKAAKPPSVPSVPSPPSLPT